MERTTRTTVTGATLAALFSLLALPAQQEPSTSPAYRLAQAKLAEARGDVAAARRTLEEALAKANDADKALLRDALAALTPGGAAAADSDSMIQKLLDDPIASARLRELLQQRGFAAAPAQDPVQRLIAVLEEGSSKVSVVGNAIEQLQNLGPLAVPQLLSALPKAGPFGVGHAIRLLAKYTDPRIPPAILARANADPLVAQVAIECSQEMSDAMREALMTGLDETKLPPPIQLQFAEVMDSAPGLEARRQAVMTRLADEPSVQGDLVSLLRQEKAPWVLELLDRLRAAPNPAVAAKATLQWLLAQPDGDEGSAIAAIEALALQHRWWVARAVTDRYTAWAKVGVRGLGGDLDKLDTQPWFTKVEWQRGGAEAALALLAVAKAYPEVGKRLANPLCNLAMAGWVVSPEHEDALAAVNPVCLALALPKDDDARALAAWARLAREHRVAFVDKVVALDRPWHRVVAAQLASIERIDEVRDAWLQRDWSGAPAEAAADLQALAERFPKATPGRPSQGTATTSSVHSNWPNALVNACARTPSLPTSILRPLAQAGDMYACNLLAKRDPRGALELAKAAENPWNYRDRMPQLLCEHGTAADAPTLRKLIAHVDTPALPEFEPFVRRHCGGDLDLLEQLQSRREPQSAPLRKAVLDGLAIAQLPDLVARLPRLPNTRLDALAAITERVRAERQGSDQAPALRGYPEHLPTLRQALVTFAGKGELTWRLTELMLAIAGPEHDAVLRELLGSSDPAVLTTALADTAIGRQPELLANATAAVLAHRTRLGSLDWFFANLTGEARAATALAVLHAPDFAQCSEELALSTLQALGSFKDVKFAAELARGAQHPNTTIRAAAAEELGRIFAREAAPFLLEMLKDDEERVREAAKQSLALLADYIDGRAKWEARLQGK